MWNGNRHEFGCFLIVRGAEYVLSEENSFDRPMCYSFALDELHFEQLAPLARHAAIYCKSFLFFVYFLNNLFTVALQYELVSLGPIPLPDSYHIRDFVQRVPLEVSVERLPVELRAKLNVSSRVLEEPVAHF